MSTWVLHIAEGGRARGVALNTGVSRVGRGPGSEVPLEDPAAPIIACSLTPVPGGCWLQPFAAITVNGAPVYGAMQIGPQDQLVIGSAMLALRAPGEPAPWVAAPPFAAQGYPPGAYAPQQPYYPPQGAPPQSGYYGQPHGTFAPQGPPPQGPYGAPPGSYPQGPYGAPPGPFANSPYAQSPAPGPVMGAPYSYMPAPAPVPPRAQVPFRKVLATLALGVLWLAVTWVAAYFAPRGLADIRPDTARAVVVGAGIGAFVLSGVLYYALLGRRSVSTTVAVLWAVSALCMFGVSSAQWAAFARPQLTLYNPLDTPVEFAIDADRRVQIAPGGYTHVEVSPRVHRVQVFAAGAPLDRFDVRTPTLGARYLATPLALGCFVREPVSYSTGPSFGHTRGVALAVQHGRRLYVADAQHVVEAPPTSLTVSGRGYGTRVLYWFHPIPCDPHNESDNPPAIPLASMVAVATADAAAPQTLEDARRGFRSQIVRPNPAGAAAPEPPAGVFQLVHYPAPPGPLAAYITPDPGDGQRHPAIVWVSGGDSNELGDMWSPGEPGNEQTASAYRQAGIVMMHPSLRGGNDNPGFREGSYGEAGDVVAAAEFLAQQPYVDPERIYLGGHSTGGTLAMLVAEMPHRFRAVFAFGPVNYLTYYQADQRPYDEQNPREAEVRSPELWLTSVQRPLFVIEGEGGNHGSLAAMRDVATNPRIHWFLVRGADHFTVLAPTNALIASRILADRGAACNIAITPDELNALFVR